MLLSREGQESGLLVASWYLSLQHANKQLPGGGVQGKFKNRELHKQRREGCEGRQTARSGSPALSTAVQGGLSLSLPQTTPQ